MSTKISQLTSATDITASDLMQIVDVEDGVMAPSGTNKKATAQLVANNLAKIVNDGAVITANTSTNAVRITQTGSGNALVVEDSANPDADPIVISNDGRMYVGYTQNIVTPVGSPKLQVQAGASFIRHSSSFAPRIDLARSDSDTIGTHAVVQSGDGIGEIGFCGSDGTNYITGATISSGVDGTPGANDMPGRLSFSTTADGAAVPTERMRITSAGNVGIGTTSPTAKLDVVGQIRNQGLLSIVAIGTGDSGIEVGVNRTDSGNSFIDLISDTTNTDYGARFIRGPGENGNTNIRHVGTGNFTIINEGAAPIRFWTNGSEKMLLESDGDVGIGTTTPSSKLHVAGDLTVSSATTATSATAGTNGDVPAQVAGYLVVNINGTARKIPYYA